VINHLCSVIISAHHHFYSHPAPAPISPAGSRPQILTPDAMHEPQVMDPFEKSLPDATVRALVDSDAAEHMLPDTSSDVVFVDGVGFSIAPEAARTVPPPAP
jgi:hypothetical protein